MLIAGTNRGTNNKIFSKIRLNNDGYMYFIKTAGTKDNLAG